MLKNNLGFPRIGNHRELKKACEKYWAGSISQDELVQTARSIRLQNWQIQKDAGIDLVPSNDFSYYDQVLDMSLMLGAIPERYQPLQEMSGTTELDLYFAMARGYQQNGQDHIAMEMTKWFDTNYHYIVPEFSKDQQFSLFSDKVVQEYAEAKAAGIQTKPVLIGPVSFLLLGKEKEEGFHRLELLDRLLPVYLEVIEKLQAQGASWIQFDEPYLVMDLNKNEKQAFLKAYSTIAQERPGLQSLLTSYFGALTDTTMALNLPVHAIQVDLVRAPEQLDAVLKELPKERLLALGIINGRNIWKTDYAEALEKVSKAVKQIGKERILLSTSCSLLHVPCDLELEEDSSKTFAEIRPWLAFARQKLEELSELEQIIEKGNKKLLKQNQEAIDNRKTSSLIHKAAVKERLKQVKPEAFKRSSPFRKRQILQHQKLQLPLFPTTTIGSFPQTKEIRQLRARYKRGETDRKDYENRLEELTVQLIEWQESLGLDVLVHGEYERNDMVEFFGEALEGFAFTKNAWVQSYGSRCVKPPIIFGDVSRPQPMTVRWSAFAQSLTQKPVKGMLTGPVTILQWSFVRDDQPKGTTAFQIALSIRDEVRDLEEAGIRIIQIDEPAMREGLPLRQEQWKHYLEWAVKAFRLASSGVEDTTQIHTHMCYSEFNAIIQDIADMDADVITMETSRSQMELLEAFKDFQYPNEIGPGVYDIHSPRVPSVEEIGNLLNKASRYLPARNIWVNPDCGLKTRRWPETDASLKNMVKAAEMARERLSQEAV